MPTVIKSKAQLHRHLNITLLFTLAILVLLTCTKPEPETVCGLYFTHELGSDIYKLKSKFTGGNPPANYTEGTTEHIFILTEKCEQ